MLREGVQYGSVTTNALNRDRHHGMAFALKFLHFKLTSRVPDDDRNEHEELSCTLLSSVHKQHLGRSLLLCREGTQALQRHRGSIQTVGLPFLGIGEGQDLQLSAPLDLPSATRRAEIGA